MSRDHVFRADDDCCCDAGDCGDEIQCLNRASAESVFDTSRRTQSSTDEHINKTRGPLSALSVG